MGLSKYSQRILAKQGFSLEAEICYAAYKQVFKRLILL
jgi:hypothetical protein